MAKPAQNSERPFPENPYTIPEAGKQQIAPYAFQPFIIQQWENNSTDPSIPRVQSLIPQIPNLDQPLTSTAHSFSNQQEDNGTEEWFKKLRESFNKYGQDSSSLQFSSVSHFEQQNATPTQIPVIPSVNNANSINSVSHLYPSNQIHEEIQSTGNTDRYDLGMTFLSHKHYADAIDSFKKVAQTDENYIKAQYYIAYSLFEQKEYKLAKNRLSNINPTDNLYKYFQFSLGMCCYKLKQFPAASEHLKKALHNNPEHEETKYFLGLCYYEQQLYDQAFSTLDRTTDWSPLYQDANIYLGKCQMSFKKYSLAKTYLEKMTNSSRLFAEAQLLIKTCNYYLNL
jgi:Tfp pilus assembly protein PilF